MEIQPEFKPQAATLIVAASDSLHPERADYYCDGTDDDVQIQAAINALPANGGKIVLLEGNYYPTSEITLVSNLTLDFTKAIIHWDTAAILFTATGTLGASTTLTANASIFDYRMSVTDSSIFSVGNYIRIRSERLIGDTKDGEIHKILAIDVGGANTIDINGHLWENYTIGNASTIDVITIIENIEIMGGQILGTSPSQSGNYDVGVFKYCSNINIHHTKVKDVARRCYIFTSCINCSILNNHIEGIAQPGYGYGVSVQSACSYINIGNNHFIYNRHSLVGGSGAGDNYGNPKFINFHDNHVELSTSPLGGSLDIHSCGGKFITIKNNVITGSTIGIGAVEWTIDGNILHMSDVAIGTRGHASKKINILNNVIFGKKSGILLTSNALEKVNIFNNVMEELGEYAVYVGNGNDAIVNINNLSLPNGNNASYDLIYTQANKVKYFNMSNSVVQFSERSGVYLIGVVGGGIITGNDMSNNDNTGLRFEDCNNFLITNNKAYDNQGTPTQNYGFRETGTSNNNVFRNNICYNNIIEQFILIGKKSLENSYTKHTDLLMDVLAVSATHVRSNEDLSAATPITFTLDAQPDISRTLSWSFDTHAQITEYDMEVIGIDAKGNSVTETWDETAGWSGETSNAFATITTIKMTSRTGTGAADTMDIGITDVIGLSNIIYATSDVFKIKKNNANATVATAQVNTTYDTYDMSVIGLAATNDFTVWYKSNLNIIS